MTEPQAKEEGGHEPSMLRRHWPVFALAGTAIAVPIVGGSIWLATRDHEPSHSDKEPPAKTMNLSQQEKKEVIAALGKMESFIKKLELQNLAIMNADVYARYNVGLDEQAAINDWARAMADDVTKTVRILKDISKKLEDNEGLTQKDADILATIARNAKKMEKDNGIYYGVNELAWFEMQREGRDKTHAEAYKDYEDRASFVAHAASQLLVPERNRER